MQRLIQSVLELLESQLGVTVPPAYHPYAVVGIAFAGTMMVVTLTAVYSGIFVFFERRIGGRMMSRVGPNRVGPQGLLQFIADAVKLIFKEDIIPYAADRPLFKLAPYLVAVGVFTGFAVLPLSPRFVAADLNIAPCRGRGGRRGGCRCLRHRASRWREKRWGPLPPPAAR